MAQPPLLKHLGRTRAKYIARVFTICVNGLEIPGLWKQGGISPLPKPGKPLDQGSFYRPITLLSPVVKILEALILYHLKEHFPLANHQHGFRQGHSTTTALSCVAPHERTIVTAIDLSKMFDTVSHVTLLHDVYLTSLPNTLKRCIANYLQGIKIRKMKQSVPQRDILSPLLFNLYIFGAIPIYRVRPSYCFF